MRIGLDFDNTLACYDQIFASESKKLGLIPESWEGSKKDLRNELRSLQNGEKYWQKIQGRVYGPCMSQAKLFPGLALFLMRCKKRGEDIFIVSHKTKYGHYDPTHTPLRRIALDWMTSKKFFEKTFFDLDPENVFFAETRKEKIKFILKLNLDIFIDDLEEIFDDLTFPNIKKILFSANSQKKYHDIVYDNWTQIGNEIFGPLKNDECRMVAQRICPDKIKEVQKITGKGNSKIYKVKTEGRKKYALKFYPDNLLDKRPRLKTEVNACKFMKDLHETPKVISYDERFNIALFDWISNNHVKKINISFIEKALDFVEKLNKLSLNSINNLPLSSEACLSASELLYQLENRFKYLELIKNDLLQKFLEKRFKPLWSKTIDFYVMKWPTSNLDQILPQTKQTLSPSDFGSHNSLLQKDGTICFIDHEYFGWDDPVKLAADFLWHPAMKLETHHKIFWLEGMYKIFENDSEFKKRFEAAYPVYGLRWILILLNEFTNKGWNNRIHANSELSNQRESILISQIKKAETICKKILMII